MDLREEGLIAGSLGEHWYYRTKAGAIELALGRRPAGALLDIGAGSGFFAREMLRRSIAGSATCVDPNYEDERDETVDGKPLLFRRSVVRPNADTVLLMDVLEHVEQDDVLLRSAVDEARPGTRFAITVPAFSWLWSGHDVFLGHYRRYTLGELRRLVAGNGLVVDEACYLYGAVFPLAAASRLAERVRATLFGSRAPSSQMRPFSRLANGLLWAVSRAELAVFRSNRMFGLTAFIIATKPG